MGFDIGDALSTVGDIVSGGVDYLFNQKSANRQMDWQQYMSNTAYQRAARDLEAAGLNRVLALGSPASTPGGASAVMHSNPMGTSYQGASSARSVRNLQQQQIANLQTEQLKTGAEAELADQQRHESMAREKNYMVNSALQVAQELETRTRIPFIQQQTKQSGAQTSLTAAQAAEQEWKNKKFLALNPFLDVLLQDVLAPMANSAKDALHSRSFFSDVFKEGGVNALKKRWNIK